MKKRVLLGNDVKSILLIRIGSLGDVVRSSVVIKLLKTKYPEAKIDMLTSSGVIPVLEHNIDINQIVTLDELSQLGSYDWIINLQNPDPPDNFLSGTNMDYPALVRHISLNVPHKFMTGRRYKGNKEKFQTNIHYCRTELEEIFFTALFSYDERMLELSSIVLNDDKINDRLLQIFGDGILDKPPVGVFFGTSYSNGIDNGTRSLSLEYLFALTDILTEKYTVVFFGQSNHKSSIEMEKYKLLVSLREDVIDLLNKTNLKELLHVISLMKVVVSTDSSPIHISLALGIPVVGLYSNSSKFKIASVKKSNCYMLFDAFEPCFYYNYRWKFFCDACMPKHSEAYRCNQKVILNQLEHISIDKVSNAVNELFKMRDDRAS
jgi:ADP-heptose:LPS heptosyltransferase